MKRDIIVIKCGGITSLEPAALCADVAELAAAGRTVVLVHGGSTDIERLAVRLGVPMPRMASLDGLTARLTDRAALEVVTLALAGRVQPRLVTALLAAAPAVGLTGVQGGLLRARRRRAQRALIDGRQVVVRDDHSGRVTSVNTGLLDCLTGAGFVPVVSPPVLADDDGSVLNADADRVAAAVAAAMRASTLLLLTAAPGVLADPSDPRSVMTVCPVPADGPPPQRGGGIGVKLLAARDALTAGVPEVLIADGTRPAPVRRALEGSGTRVRLAALEPGGAAMSRALAASGRMEEEAATGLLRQMLEIPSPSGEEAELAGYLAEAMTGLGLAAHLDQAGNVVGEAGQGESPHVMLLSHLDTVPGRVPVRSAAGRLYGRGASDAKGPLAAMICAAAGAAGFPGRISVIGAVEEEVPSARGAVAVRDTYRPPDFCIIGEPSGGSAVVLGYKGKLDLSYSARCPSAHPTSPAPKASELVVDCWAVLKEIIGPTDHTVFTQPGLTLESVSGDTAHAVAKIGVRTPVGFDDGALLAEARARLNAGTLTVVGARSPCLTDRHNPVVRALTAGIRQRSGQPRLLVKTATSDMNTLLESWDVPIASYGPGDSRLDHADDEHIDLADYFRGIEVLSYAVSELACTPPDSECGAGRA